MLLLFLFISDLYIYRSSVLIYYFITYKFQKLNILKKNKIWKIKYFLIKIAWLHNKMTRDSAFAKRRKQFDLWFICSKYTCFLHFKWNAKNTYIIRSICFIVTTFRNIFKLTRLILERYLNRINEDITTFMKFSQGDFYQLDVNSLYIESVKLHLSFFFSRFRAGYNSFKKF